MPSNSFSNLLYNFLEKHKVYLVYLPLVIYWIIIFILTTIPGKDIPYFFPNQDKYTHSLAYFVLAVMLTLCLHFQSQFPLLNSKTFLFALIFVLLYGALDEFHQYFIPSRSCDFFDWISDAIGGSIGVFLTFLFLKNKKISAVLEPNV
jgi:VanZ family protein